MDYEKKYNEALERAKEIKGKILQSHLSTESCKAISEYIDTIIPELNESEDEKIRKALIEALTVSNTIGELKFRLPEPTREECIAWLEKQKEQKPAEWSEEDEKNLGQVISGKYLPLGFREWFCGLPERFSSRPSWKPSEEQMTMLLAIINDPNNAGAESCHLAMKSLYEQLKKL